jgi:hypothetical protein
MFSGCPPSIGGHLTDPSRFLTPTPQMCSLPCAVQWNCIVPTSVLKGHILLFQLSLGKIKICHRCCQVSSVRDPTEHVVVIGGKMFALIARRSLENNMAEGLRLKPSQIQETYRRAILKLESETHFLVSRGVSNFTYCVEKLK